MNSNGLSCIYRNELTVNTVSEETALNLRNEISPNTEKAYTSDLNHFSQWLSTSTHDISPPHSPECISDYVSEMGQQGYSLNTIDRRLRAISWYYKINGEENPPSISLLVRKTVSGMVNRKSREGDPYLSLIHISEPTRPY